MAPTEPAPSRFPSLTEFVRDHVALIGTVGGLTGLASFVVDQPLGWAGTYLRVLLLGAAVLVWLELLSRWPDELRLDRRGYPHGISWRMVGFAYLVQLTMVWLVASIVWRAPEILVPAVAVGVGLVAWRFFAGRLGASVHGRHRLILTWVGVVAVVLTSELVLELVSPEYRSLFAEAWQALERVAP